MKKAEKNNLGDKHNKESITDFRMLNKLYIWKILLLKENDTFTVCFCVFNKIKWKKSCHIKN